MSIDSHVGHIALPTNIRLEEKCSTLEALHSLLPKVLLTGLHYTSWLLALPANIRQVWKVIDSDKHSSLLQYGMYGRKKF